MTGLRKKKTMTRKGKKQRVHQLINHAKWWRLRSSPTEHKENHELELQGPANHRTSKILSHLVREQAPNVLFLMETKQTMDEMRKIQADLRYDNFLVVPCVRRAGGLAMLWKDEVNLDIKTYSLNHIDAHIMTDPHAS